MMIPGHLSNLAQLLHCSTGRMILEKSRHYPLPHVSELSQPIRHLSLLAPGISQGNRLLEMVVSVKPLEARTNQQQNARSRASGT